MEEEEGGPGPRLRVSRPGGRWASSASGERGGRVSDSVVFAAQIYACDSSFSRATFPTETHKSFINN